MTQSLTDWIGDVGSLITEMKRRAGVRTDQDLARFIGLGQSTVSNWRMRGAVPEAAILQFERALDDPEGAHFARSLAARTIALRIPEFWFERLAGRSNVGRSLPYSVVATGFNGIVAEIASQLARLEDETGRGARDLVPILLEDARFLGGIVDWLASASASDILAREVAAARK